MLLHSFGRDFRPWNEYARTIRTELERQSRWPLDITDHSLVTSRFTDDGTDHAFMEYLRALHQRQPFDLIVSLGAPAASFVQRRRQQLFPTVPMILSAVEQRRVQYIELGDNDTVVAIRNDFAAFFENVLQVLPDTQTIAIVTGSSPIEKYWAEELRKETSPFESRAAFIWYNKLSFEDILKNAAALPAHSAIFWQLMNVDAAGVTHEGDTALARLYAVANAPIFSFQGAYFGREIVGGPMHSVLDASRATAAVAVRILGGERPSDIKLPSIGLAAPKFDWRKLQRWSIGESRLPMGSEVYFRQPTLWDQYRFHILAVVAALVVQGMMILWLLYEHWRRRVAETQSIQQMHELARMNRIATAGQLSASIAHELRQPLTAIASSGSAGLNWLSHKVPDLEEARAALQAVVKQSYRADDVIQSVRAMFGHQTTAVRTEVNLSELVRQVLALVRRSISSNSVVLNTKLADDPPPLVMADPVQLQQVVLNLINNAVEAMATASHSPRILNIDARTDQDGNVLLAVADTGPGFDTKVAANIFNPFVTTKAQGMGMGLSICKSIVEQHGGRLTAVSVQPHGALLTIALPGSKSR